jgi:hypothetical protein
MGGEGRERERERERVRGRSEPGLWRGMGGIRNRVRERERERSAGGEAGERLGGAAAATGAARRATAAAQAGVQGLRLLLLLQPRSWGGACRRGCTSWVACATTVVRRPVQSSRRRGDGCVSGEDREDAGRLGPIVFGCIDGSSEHAVGFFLLFFHSIPLSNRHFHCQKNLDGGFRASEVRVLKL